MNQHDDGAPPPGPTVLQDREEAVAHRLRALSGQLDTAPDPQYRARARARLVAMTAVRGPAPAHRPLRDRLLAARAADRPPSRWRTRLTAGLAGAAVGVTGLAALVAVAAGAQPGDPLYDLKRGTEQTQLALAGESRGQTLLELARTRLAELERLDPGGDAGLALATLRAMDRHTLEGAAWLTERAVQARDAGALDELLNWAATQSGRLRALGANLPMGARPASDDSATLLDQVTVRTDGLSAALGCRSGPVVIGADRLGPVPGDCPGDAAPSPAPEEPPVPAVPSPGTDGPPPAAPQSPSAPPTTEGPPPAGAPGGAPGRAPGGAPSDSPGSGAPPLTGGPAPWAVPEVSVPGRGTGTPPVPPVVDVPAPGPLRLCLPPLATIGDC
ncbi:DUF5667 domain-containing protein [Blastococcus montanus]|uniref:DUF5667 domain-containing protein n=1 Tax=Blastococcus montanus TaxID=3144973 RepID=UPI00320A0456